MSSFQIDKQFGYFPKDAVKIDEVFVDEKKEIEMSTQVKNTRGRERAHAVLLSVTVSCLTLIFPFQRTDFFCTDASGTLITNHEEFEDYEFGDQTAESEELGNSDFDDRVSEASETHDNVETRHIDNDNKDRGEPELSGSSWIRSAVSGWFANDANEGGNGNKEYENFKSRKLALDLEQQDEEERQTEILHWIGDELTNSKDETEKLPNEQSRYVPGNGIKILLGFGEGNTQPSETKKLSLKEQQEATCLKVEDSAETMTEKERVEEKDAGWYDSVYNRITNFYGDPSDKSEASKDEGRERCRGRGMHVNKVTISKDGKNPEVSSESLLTRDSPSDRNTANQDEKQEVRSQDHSDESSRLGGGWYGSVYNRIAGFYGDTSDGNDAPDESNVIENSRGDPQVTSETADVRSRRDQKLETSDHTAEKTSENNNTGWYDSVYGRISNMYGDSSDKHDATADVEGQTQNENTRDTSSPSVFSMNGLSSVIYGLRSPSKGAGSDDEPKLSESVTSEPGLTDQSDAMTLKSDDDDDDTDEDSGLTVKENTDILLDTDQSQVTSQSMFSVNHLSKMIDGLKSPFKANDAGDKEESDGEKTPDTGKDGQCDDDDESDNDDELSVRSTDVISEISSPRAALGSEEGGKAVQEENIAEAQINTVERSLDCKRQDVSDDGENISTDIRTSSTVEKDELGDQSDSGSAHLSTHQSKNLMFVLNTDETETLTEEPGWTEVAKHVSDALKSHESDTNARDVNKRVPEKYQFTESPRGEDPQSESETRSDSGLQVRTDVIENNSKTVGESDEAQDEGEAAVVLPEKDEAGMEVNSSEVAQTLHMASNDQKHNVDVTQMEYSGEREVGDNIEKEHCRKNEGVDVTQMESGGEKEDTEATQMGNDGEKATSNITPVKNGGEKESGVTQMEYSGGQEDGDVAQMESNGENKSIDITQVEYAGGKKGVAITQIETDGEEESLNITQMEYGGEKGGDLTQVASGGEKERVDLIQKEQPSSHTAQGLENIISETKQNLQLDPDDSKESEEGESAAVKQAGIWPKNIRGKSSTDGSETDGNQNEHVRGNNGDKMMDVKYHKARRSALTQKHTYPGLQAHLCEEHIQDLLKFFGAETLSWLDFMTGHSEYINNEELAEFYDFQRTLEHLLKTRNPEIKPSPQTIQTALVMLREKFIPVIADGSVDKSPGTTDVYTHVYIF